MPLAPQITNTPVDIVVKDFAISSVAHTSSTATYTATGHTFASGDTVIVSGIVPDGYNGTFTITSIATNTFTVANTTNAAVTTSSGDAFSADNTDYDQSDVSRIFIPNSEDLSDPAINPALAQAQQAISDAATAIATANTANAAATSAAYTAGVAQTTANGKNTAHYSTSGPSGSGTTGDLWFQVDSGGTVLYQYAYNGSSWISAPISNTVISNLDAGKINAGTITGIAYNNGSGTFSVSPSGVLVASSATITGTIYATAGTFTGTVTATAGSFTGDINASGGTIGGFTIGSTYLYSGNLSLYSSGTISGGNSSTIYYGYANIGGGTNYGTDRLYVTGNSSFVGNQITTGNITGQSNIYYPYHPTTGSSANAYINSSTGLIARSTSSLKYKVDVEPQMIPLESILALEPKSYFDKGEADANGSTEGLHRILGVIAEEVANIPVLGDLLMNRNQEGNPDSINYDRIAVALLPLLKDLNNRVTKLEGK
jgi:hypothetical protein